MLPEDLRPLPGAHVRHLTDASNSNSRGFTSLSGPQGCLHTCLIHAYTDTHIIFIKILIVRKRHFPCPGFNPKHDPRSQFQKLVVWVLVFFFLMFLVIPALSTPGQQWTYTQCDRHPLVLLDMRVTRQGVTNLVTEPICPWLPPQSLRGSFQLDVTHTWAGSRVGVLLGTFL